MRALVLSGGGAKGAYEIGVWKALRKLNIKFDIVTGTSIGAINGAFVVQNKYYRAKRIWLSKDINKYFGEDFVKLNNNKKALKIYSKNIINRKGIDTEGFTKFLKSNINTDKLYNSNVKYGIITYDLKNFRPKYITKENTDEKDIIDYIVASGSAYPALDIKKVKDKPFVDGGYFDNLPINFAIDLGADEIIAVDLQAIGLKRETKDKNIKITLIKPSADLGNFLVFDKDINRRNFNLGYNDTMKAFNKLDGNNYTFKKNDLDKNYEKYKEDFNYIVKRMININSKRILNELNNIPIYKRILNNTSNDKISMNKSLELLGEIFELPVDKIYDIKLFNHMIKVKFANNNDKNLINISNIKKLKVNKVINRQQLVKTIYKYLTSPIEYYKEISEISMIFPKEFMATLYLYTIY